MRSTDANRSLPQLNSLLVSAVSHEDQWSAVKEAVEEVAGGHVVLAEVEDPSPWLVLVLSLSLVDGGDEREGPTTAEREVVVGYVCTIGRTGYPDC